MTDERHDPDTLFLVFEQDFCATAADAARREHALTFQPPAEPIQPPCRRRGIPLPPPSEALYDLVCLCNAAHRYKVGDFVWLSWDPESARKTWDSKARCWRSQLSQSHIHGGSTAIAVSVEGASSLRTLFNKDWAVRSRPITKKVSVQQISGSLSGSLSPSL